MRKLIAVLATLAVSLTLLIGMTAPVSAAGNTATLTVVSNDTVQWSANGTTWQAAVPCWVDSVWPTSSSIADASWIWMEENTNPAEEYADVPAGGWYFQKTFDLPASASDIAGSISIDADNAFELYVNGTDVGGEGVLDKTGDTSNTGTWATIMTFDLAGLLQPGTNTILVRAINYFDYGSSSSNPAGLIFEANVTYCPGEVLGLFSPYSPDKAYKVDSSIPLKWQFANCAGNVIASPDANPSVQIVFVDSITPATILTSENASGASGYQYDSTTDTWQYNWQTKGMASGTYDIVVSSDVLGITSQKFPIQLR